MSLAIKKKLWKNVLIVLCCWQVLSVIHGSSEILFFLCDFKELHMCQAEWMEAWKSSHMQRENRLVISKQSTLHVRPRKLSHGIDLYRHTRGSAGVGVVFDWWAQIAMFPLAIGSRNLQVLADQLTTYGSTITFTMGAVQSLCLALLKQACMAVCNWSVSKRCWLCHVTIVSDLCATTLKPCHIGVSRVFRLHTQDRLQKSEPAPYQLMQTASSRNFGNGQRSCL